VLEIILGVGALAHALEIAPKDIPLFKLSVSSHPSNKYYVDAIAYFTRSLAKFRQRIATSEVESTARTVLISTILFSTFEVLQGNSESADELLYAGIKPLKNKILHSAWPQRQSQIAGSCDDERVEDAEFILMRGLSFRSLLLPMSDQVRDDICACKLRYTEGPKPPGPMESCERFWKLWMQFLTVALRWYIKSQHPGENYGPVDDGPRLLQEQRSLLARAQEWETATQQRLADEQDVYGRSLLKKIVPGLKTIHIYLQLALDDTEETNHQACRTAHEIFDLAESILDEAPLIQAGLAFLGEIYEGVACALLGLIRICREADVRSKGMALCRKVVNAHSRWDSEGIVMGTFALGAIEETGRDQSGAIPLAARYDWVVSAWNDEYTELHAVFRARAAKEGAHHDNVEERRVVLRLRDFGLA
jgi:hypothetical protein